MVKYEWSLTIFDHKKMHEKLRNQEFYVAGNIDLSNKIAQYSWPCSRILKSVIKRRFIKNIS